MSTIRTPELQHYGWSQLDDGDWQYRDPSIAELVFLQSIQQWTTVPPTPRPHHYGGLRVQGRPDFVIGADGQVTAERGMHFHRPLMPSVVSEGALTIQALYGHGKSRRMFDQEFAAANPHLRFLRPDAPIPAGVRAHVPHHWAPHLQQAGYVVHRPHAPTGLGDAATIGDMLTTLQNINSAPITVDSHGIFSRGTYTSAVTSRKTAGQLAIDQLNPDVDITFGDVAKPFTTAAWTINGDLAAVNQNGSTVDDANRAQYLLMQIVQQYINATNAVKAVAPPPGPPPSAPGVPVAAAPPPSPPPPGLTPSAVAAATRVAGQPAPRAVIPASMAPAGGGAGAPSSGGGIGGLPIPWIIGGVIGAAALLGVGVAVLKKKKAA